MSRPQHRRARRTGTVLNQAQSDAVFAPPFNRELAVKDLRAKARAGLGQVTISSLFATALADQLEKDAPS